VNERDGTARLDEATITRIVSATPPPEEHLDIIERLADLPEATLTVEGTPDTR
jgi:hypothetical protein